MIRHGNKIRLTGREKAAFAAHTGNPVAPTTVDAFNRQMESSAQDWDTYDTPEAKLLAHMNRIGKIDETRETPCLVVDSLLSEQQDGSQD